MEEIKMGIVNLGYVIIDTKNQSEWVHFAKNILGFKEADIPNPSGTKFLRMDEAPFRYMIEEGDTNKLFSAGYEVSNESDFNILIKKLSLAGVAVKKGETIETEKRAVTEFVYCLDPSGNRVELFHTRHTSHPFTPTTASGISGFVTGDMGLGHLVIPAPENEKTESFYTQLLGFEICDDLRLPPFAKNLPEQRILFMHADNPRHHTLALYNFPNPVGVLHLMVEVKTIDEVGYCRDRVKEAGLHIFSDLGRHSNDEMVSFYFFAPGGIGIEVGYDGKQVHDWSHFKPTKTTSGDYWGHQFDAPSESA